MKLNSAAITLSFLIAALSAGQTAKPGSRAPSKVSRLSAKTSTGTASAQSRQAAAADSSELQAVLARMNQAAPNFHTFQAGFEWQYFDKLINQLDTQQGQAYFRRRGRAGSDVEALFNVQRDGGKPGLAKQVLYKDSKVRLYEVTINRITERDVGKNKADVDAFMSLGLGGRGDELAASFTIHWLGWETIDDVKAAKLEVTGKKASIQKVFSRAVLWIDPARDIALQQQFFLGSAGDYRLTRYHNIRFNHKIADGVFRLQAARNPQVMQLH